MNELPEYKLEKKKRAEMFSQLSEQTLGEEKIAEKKEGQMKRYWEMEDEKSMKRPRM